MSEITIVATLTIKSDFQAPLLEALKKIVDSSRAEEGCYQYDLHQTIAIRWYMSLSSAGLHRKRWICTISLNTLLLLLSSLKVRWNHWLLT